MVHLDQISRDLSHEWVAPLTRLLNFTRLWLGVMAVAHGSLKLISFTVAAGQGEFNTPTAVQLFGVVLMVAEFVSGVFLLLSRHYFWAPLVLMTALASSIGLVVSGLGWGFGSVAVGAALPSVLLAMTGGYLLLKATLNEPVLATAHSTANGSHHRGG